MSSSQVTVWFDQRCPLCRREIAAMRWLDRAKRIEFVDVADPNATCPLDRSEMLARFHTLENGQLLSGAAAFAAMWRAIPLLWPLGMAAKLPFFERRLDWLYGHFLRIRPRLQRLFDA
jgi:predicted DCC family thiol-disulfide oxidoreductase YuxK